MIAEQLHKELEAMLAKRDNLVRELGKADGIIEFISYQVKMDAKAEQEVASQLVLVKKEDSVAPAEGSDDDVE